MKTYYDQYCRQIGTALAETKANQGGTACTPDEALSLAVQWCRETQQARGTVYFCGNGASAAMASHMSLDWLKCAMVRALCFNDLASLTAFGNDTGFDNVFALPLRELASPGDLLVTISSSGNSPNVVAALQAAKRMNVRCVTLSGFRPDNKSRVLGDLNFYVPAETYGIAESCHQVILHAWLDCYVEIYPPQAL